MKAVAAHFGVSYGTVRRWLRGIDRPPADAQEAIEGWLLEQREKAGGKP